MTMISLVTILSIVFMEYISHESHKLHVVYIPKCLLVIPLNSETAYKMNYSNSCLAEIHI